LIEETGSSQSKRERAVGSIPLLLLVVSVAMNVVLGHQLSLLRESASLRPFLNGSQAPDINLQGTDGENPHLAFGQGKTPVLFYWFSPSCSWCEANLANFKALSSQAQGKYRFVAVSSAPLTELKAYQERYDLTFLSITSPRRSPRTIASREPRKLSSCPVTAP